MPNPNKKLGKAILKINGNALPTKEGAKLRPGGVSRTSMSDTIGHGFNEQDVPGHLECTVDFKADTSLAEIQAMDDVTVSFECDTGQSYVGANWWVTDALEVTSGSSSGFSLVLEGPPAEEVK